MVLLVAEEPILDEPRIVQDIPERRVAPYASLGLPRSREG